SPWGAAQVFTCAARREHTCAEHPSTSANRTQGYHGPGDPARLGGADNTDRQCHLSRDQLRNRRKATVFPAILLASCPGVCSAHLPVPSPLKGGISATLPGWSFFAVRAKVTSKQREPSAPR